MTEWATRNTMSRQSGSWFLCSELQKFEASCGHEALSCTHLPLNAALIPCRFLE
jgi:hypothetical protein